MTKPPTKKVALNYLSGDSQPSLLRNGRVGKRKDLSGNDCDIFGLEIEEVLVDVRDLRVERAEQPTLEKEGFVLKQFYEEVEKYDKSRRVPDSPSPMEEANPALFRSLKPEYQKVKHMYKYGGLNFDASIKFYLKRSEMMGVMSISATLTTSSSATTPKSSSSSRG